MALPLVTGNGAIAIAWTGAVDGNARVGVKAARLTSSGLRPPSSSRATRGTPRSATRRSGRAVRRRSSGRSSTPRPTPHVRRAVAWTGRLVRAARSADAGRRDRHRRACRGLPDDHRPGGRDGPDHPGQQRWLRVGGAGAVARQGLSAQGRFALVVGGPRPSMLAVRRAARRPWSLRRCRRWPTANSGTHGRIRLALRATRAQNVRGQCCGERPRWRPLRSVRSRSARWQWGGWRSGG